jgi:hypothetical protein
MTFNNKLLRLVREQTDQDSWYARQPRFPNKKRPLHSQNVYSIAFSAPQMLIEYFRAIQLSISDFDQTSTNSRIRSRFSSPLSGFRSGLNEFSLLTWLDNNLPLMIIMVMMNAICAADCGNKSYHTRPASDDQTISANFQSFVESNHMNTPQPFGPRKNEIRR